MAKLSTSKATKFANSMGIRTITSNRKLVTRNRRYAIDSRGPGNGTWVQTASMMRNGTNFDRQVMSTRTGISFLMGMVRNEGRSILKSEQVAGTTPVMRTWLPSSGALEGDVLIMGGLASELNFKIGIDGGRRDRILRKAGAHDDHGKLGATGGLKHVQVAIGVSRIE